MFEEGERRDNHPVIKDLFPFANEPADVRCWYRLVTSFSFRQLSYGSDKLAAIAGLATECEEQGWCQGYLVGLWKSDILRGLWWNNVGKPRNEHDTNRLFPSWSWTSSNGPVRWDLFPSDQQRIRTRYDIDVESMRVNLSDESKTATKVKGSLTFKAFMVLFTNKNFWSHQDRIFIQEEASPFLRNYSCIPIRPHCCLVRMATWKETCHSPGSDEFTTLFLLLETDHKHKGNLLFRRVGTFSKSHDVPDEQLTINEMVERTMTII